QHAIGASVNNLNYQIPSTAANHSFRLGGSNDDGTLLCQIRGDGKMILGNTSTPYGKLTFNNDEEAKITFCSQDAESHHGIGYSLQTIVDSSGGSTVRPQFNFHLKDQESEFAWYAQGINGKNNVSRQLMKLFRCNAIDGGRPQLYIGMSTDGNGSIHSGYRGWQLQLESNSAHKATDAYWHYSSDERVKENIVHADIDLCYQSIKNIPLKRYSYRQDIQKISGSDDHVICGWIAQDVEKYYPKSIEVKPSYGIPDCKHLNISELQKALYGCVQKLIEKVEKLEADNETLKTELSELKKLAF
ncbi:MAG: tail fiber domain-containing protein, partial [Bacteroidota bacterium]